MLKKGLSILSILTIISLSSFACWFTQENYKNAYFAGINYYFEHYFNTTNNISTAYYINGAMNQNGNVSSYYSVSLPLTPWFKVSSRTQYVNNEIQSYDIRVTKLYYKIVSGNIDENAASAPWRLAKSINKGNNPKWRLNFSSPVKLFGENVITKELIESKGDTISNGDGIILLWWFADNSPNSIMNIQEITDGSTYPNIIPGLKDSAETTYEGEYIAAYVMRVVYNGKNIKTGR